MSGFSRFAIGALCGAGLLCFALLGHVGTAQADDRSGGPTASAKIQGAGDTKDKITGLVRFSSVPDGVRVVADIDGLAPGKHGFHIHEKPDISAPDLTSAGGHFNPGGHKHGGPDSAEHHAGDLGNLTADEKGHAHLDQIFKGLTIEGPAGVVKHSVIIHAKEDDLKTDPAGNSGARIAGGIIALDAEKEPGKS